MLSFLTVDTHGDEETLVAEAKSTFLRDTVAR